MNYRCEDCGNTTEIKVNDFCPRCGSEKFKEIKPEERLYLKSIKCANNLMSFGNTLSILMIIVGTIIALVGLLFNFVLLAVGITCVFVSILIMHLVKKQSMILMNIAELNRKTK